MPEQNKETQNKETSNQETPNKEIHFPLWAAEQFLRTPVETLKGVGPKIAEKLKKLGICRIRELLFHLPARYEDKTHLVPIPHLREGQYALVQGRLQESIVKVPNKKYDRVLLSEGGKNVQILFFHLKPHQIAKMQKDAWLRCYGQVKRFGRDLGFLHPEFEVLADPYHPFPKHYTPIYPSTEGLSQKRIHKLVQQALCQYLPLLAQDLLPKKLCDTYQLSQFSEALQTVHAPPNTLSLDDLNAKKSPIFDRLFVEELLAYQLALQQSSLQTQKFQAEALPAKADWMQAFLSQLPFSMTRAQDKAFDAIAQDMAKMQPMRRLLQGDVGSGKTLVAVKAAILALSHQKQVLFLVPTEILAKQHYRTIKKWLTPLGISLGFLSGQMTPSEKEKQCEAIRLGTTQIIVGTHALLQPQVSFADLGFVIIDEQHRFGVGQRQTLLTQQLQQTPNKIPHLLMMTATPIPRTLAMTFFSDLDLSVIDSLPPGRKPIRTAAVGQSRRGEIVQKIANMAETGQQVYWVCPVIEDSMALACEGAEKTAQKLQGMLPNLNVGLVHGKQATEIKESNMKAFEQGVINVLVATTVVEVGVDVPNATLIVIESPERLGLAQCHQLRGRVGRGKANSVCVLLYQSPLTESAKARIEALRKTQDGFKLAELDLTLRGPGELLGNQQSGTPTFKVADLLRDTKWVNLLPKLKEIICQEAPHYIQPLLMRWGWVASEIGVKMD